SAGPTTPKASSTAPQTTTPAPAPTTQTPPASPTPQSRPASTATAPSSFPSTSNTGHRTPLAQLTPSGSITVTQDGAVLQGLHIRGSVTIEANGVTIRDSFIEYDGSMYPIRMGSGAA